MTPRRNPAIAITRADALHWGALLAILAVALFVRLWQLDTLPPGLYRDEATNGLDALRVVAGERPLYFTANNGREPLYFYLLAASVSVLGRSPGALRLVSALLGSATILSSYWLARELLGRRAGLLLAALLAASVWPVNLSRIALRAVSLPLVSAAMLACLWRGLRLRRSWLMVAAGALWGLAFYTYLAARFTLITLPLIALYLWALRPAWRWPRGWLLLALAAALVATPLAIYVLTHWQATMGRAGQVSIVNSAINQGDLWGALAHNIWRTALGPFVRGDFIPRHNVPLRPVFGWLMAPFGAAGLVLALARARRDAVAGLILLWCAGMALPTVLAEGAPHFLRGVGVLPVLYLLPVMGLEWVAALVSRWQARPTTPALRATAVPPAAVAPLLLAALLTVYGIMEMGAYRAHLQSLDVYYNFEAGATELAARINRYLGAGWTGDGLAVAKRAEPTPARFVALDARLTENWPALTFLAPEDERIVRPEQLSDQTSSPLALAVWPYADLQPLLSRLPAGQVVDVRPGAWERGDLMAQANQLYSWIEVGAAEQPAHELFLAWEEGITLRGYTLSRTGNQVEVTLWWQAERPVSRDYTVFCQAMSAGRQVGQTDGPPALGLFPTSHWHLHKAIIDRRTVSVDNDGGVDAQFYVGLYDPETMQRLRLLGPGGSSAEDYVILD